MGRPAATVVVPAHRAEATIAACLRAILAQDLDCEFEVIVVASGPGNTAAIVRSAFPGAVLLRSRQSLTPGASRNAGIRFARGEIVAFCAADCVPAPSWLRLRVERHRQGHRLVAGAVDPDPDSGPAGLAQYMVKFGGSIGYANRTFRGTGPLYHLSYDRELLRGASPFPERGTVGEDTLFNQALVESGERVLFDSRIRVTHLDVRDWREVRLGLRRQAAEAGRLARSGPVGRHFGAWSKPRRLRALRMWWRLWVAVGEHRPGLRVRFLISAPWVLAGLRTYAEGFAAGFRGQTEALPAAPPPAMAALSLPRVPSGPPVSVVIAVYNEERWLGACLDSILEQTYRPLEILVVDDGSGDLSPMIAERRGVTVIRRAHRGPAAARNAGAAAAGGSILVFLDGDMALEPDAIERLVAPILKGECVGTFSKELLVANPTNPWAACWTLNRGLAPGHMFPAVFPDRWANYRAVRRDLFLAAGGYDDVGYGEDMTLAPKLGQLAHAAPGARMWHNNPSSLAEVWENARWIGRGVRVRELPHVYRRYAPWRSLGAGVAVARRAGNLRYLPFKLVYDLGVLAGHAASGWRPTRHWK